MKGTREVSGESQGLRQLTPEFTAMLEQRVLHHFGTAVPARPKPAVRELSARRTFASKISGRGDCASR
jgi:hypothetical protein